MIKCTDEEPDEEIHSSRSGRSQKTGVSVPPEMEGIAFLVRGAFTNLEFPKPYTLGIFVEVSSHRHNWSSTLFLALLPSHENGERNWGLQAAVMAWSFWWQALIQKPTQSHLIRAKTLLSPRKLQRFCKPCVRNWGQRESIRTKGSLPT